MIGVLVNPSEEDVAREFFQLFKTPWEFHRRHRTYEILLSTADTGSHDNARLVIRYAGHKLGIDPEEVEVRNKKVRPWNIAYLEHRIPIYGDGLTFPAEQSYCLADEDTQEPVAYVKTFGRRAVARIGYDLFSEVETLLTVGQTITNALIPTLELHIALLRNVILGCGIPVVEIPPVPHGYNFIACLTHDVDHPFIREHRWDRTMVGFLYRALVGSLRNLILRRTSLHDCLRNWRAALSLPFVYMNLARDFWCKFANSYLELERDVSSTFFVIPFKNYSGASSSGRAPRFRAARYAAKDIAEAIHNLMNAGSEVGLHGLDAWLNTSRARAELNEIRSLTRHSELGVRMHWLYYGEQSAKALDQAGATYDSTVGYNETVGYRAGTTQCYKPLQADRLLELPLHVMDTALFYPAYLALSFSGAKRLIQQFIENAVYFGGCITTNWHDRSILPERLWDTCYRELLDDLRSNRAWFATAGRAVAWFRLRREMVFEADSVGHYPKGDNMIGVSAHTLPSLQLRIYLPQASCGQEPRGCAPYVDVPFEGHVDGILALVASKTHGSVARHQMDATIASEVDGKVLSDRAVG